MNIVAIIQARMGSTRLPGKVLLDLHGEPMLMRVVQNVRCIAGVNQIIVATTTEAADNALCDLCVQRGHSVFRGSEEDVLDRYYKAAMETGADHVLRVTSDCPFLCASEADRVISRHLESGADYTHNITVWGSGMPLGTGCEIFTMQALETSWKDGLAPHHREHVDEYIYEQRHRFRFESVMAPQNLREPQVRLTVDEAADLELARAIYGRLYRVGEAIALADILALLHAEPNLLAINRNVVQKRS